MGHGNVLEDIIDSDVVPIVKLNTIFRQAAKSKIIVNAHNVNEGRSFILDKSVQEQENDFFYINEQNKDKMLYHAISLCSGRLASYGNYDFYKDMQVLTPTKKGALGTKELNKSLQQVLNPSSDLKDEKQYGEQTFRVGDRVMQVKNNYDIFWTKDEEHGTGIFNGEIGRIKNIDNEAKQIKIEYDDEKVAWYQYSELDQIEHSYAVTIHKAQRKRV